MNKLSKKIRNNEGFTLVEMLIVVAIIAILIAISIPLVDSALQRARHATDAANERAAKAAILIKYMDGAIDTTATDFYAYDAKAGSVAAKNTAPTDATYGQHQSHKNKYIVMNMDATGKITMGWNNAVTVPAGAKLCSDELYDSSH